MFMYVCTHVCVHICICFCMYVRMYECRHISMHEYEYEIIDPFSPLDVL